MVVFVATQGSGAMDIYARKLAENLNVSKIYTNIYQKTAEVFNISWFSQKAGRVLWEDWRFVRMLNRIEGIFHLPNHHLGRYGNFLKRPFIITVHDLIRYFDWKGYPVSIHKPNFRDRIYLGLDYKGIRKAKKIIAVSQNTKRDLIRYFGIPEEKISVVYEGVDHNLFKPIESKGQVDDPYILYIGSEHPRKNLAGLLKAFKKVKEEKRFKDLKLVKVGKAGGKEADFRKQTLDIVQNLGLEKEVIFTEFVPEKELPFYYSGAECFVFPSLFEGFGLPPLEAMACGCPVIASNVASLPEIVGNGGLLIDPHDENDLFRALSKILDNPNLKRELVKKGFEQARKFSWGKAAKETLKVYQEVENML